MLVVSHGGVILALWGGIAPGSPAAPDDPTGVAELLDVRAGARRRRVAARRGVTVDDDAEAAVRAGALEVLRASWREADGFCPPNPEVYPHQWLWDSCFHAIAWSALGDGGRGVRELTSCLDGQLDSGFVPHMRYLGPSANRGPLTDRSSFTQPPIYAHAARVLAGGGHDPGAALVGRIASALDWLWRHRRTPEGLIYVVHPWETGTDDSPRWDDWVSLPGYDHAAYSAFDRELVAETYFDSTGAAVWSRSFASAPASFNALCAHAALECAVLTGDDRWRERGEELAGVADDLLWDEREGLWIDRPLIGGGPRCRVPTLDGALGALVTDDAGEGRAGARPAERPGPVRRAVRAGLPASPAPLLRPGPVLARGRLAAAELPARPSRPSAGGTTRRTPASARCRTPGRSLSGFAEYWNPEDGAGLGAIPQGWAAVVAAL